MDYIMKCKERGHKSILTSSIHCCDEMSKEELVSFWGLNGDDIEWYHLYQLVNEKEVEL